MSMDDEFEQWLQAQPLDEPVEIDGESVYLKVSSRGAELGVFLIRSFAPSQLQEALKQGFNSATKYDAGLGRTPDGENLVLNLWLPNVSGWLEAAQPLEDLLNQVCMWRDELAPPKTTHREGVPNKTEQRLRKLFQGAK
jgi:hypothetical protein